MESILRLVAFMLIAYALVLWVSAVVWTYRDVRNRTADQTSQLIAVLLVAVFNLPGLLVYMVIRPQATMADAYERSLETEAMLQELQITYSSCQNCQRPIDDDFNVCPHCRTLLREPCRNCGRAVRTNWTTCPYCAVDRVINRTTAANAATADSDPLEPPVRRTTRSTRSSGQASARTPGS